MIQPERCISKHECITSSKSPFVSFSAIQGRHYRTVGAAVFSIPAVPHSVHLADRPGYLQPLVPDVLNIASRQQHAQGEMLLVSVSLMTAAAAAETQQ